MLLLPFSFFFNNNFESKYLKININLDFKLCNKNCYYYILDILKKLLNITVKYEINFNLSKFFFDM